MNFKGLTIPAPFLPPSLLPFVEIFSFSLTPTDKSESSLAVQWLGLRDFTAGDPGSILHA